MMCFKVRKLRPCVVSHVKFDVELPDDNVVQIVAIATVMSIVPSNQPHLAVVPSRSVVCFVDVCGDS